MTVVSGASSPALVGVLGDVAIEGNSRTPIYGLFVGSTLIDGGESELPGLFEVLWLFLLVSLLIRSPRAPPSPEGFMEARSGLFGGLAPFFRDPGVKTSFIRAPGETPRLLLPPAALSDVSIFPLSRVAAR